jgi:enoyl-CoA hydratase/carnithine racemase
MKRSRLFAQRDFHQAGRKAMPTQSEPAVLLNVTDGVGWITLNRPKAYNAINTDLAGRLLDTVIRCDEDDDVRALVITGNGPSFCSGGDIRQMMDAVANDGNAAAFLKTLTVSLHETIATMAHMSKPVIMAVNGAAAGAGFSLALETQMEHERRAIATCGRTADFREGADAFFAKRPAKFYGR